MSELELQDHILRLALELQRYSAYSEAEADAILQELVDDLRALMNSGVLSEKTKPELAALIKQAETAIEARYAAIPQAMDTHGLIVMVSERTVEAMQALTPTIAKVSAERLASLAKDVLIDGAPSKAWWDKQAEDTAFKFAAQVRQGVINGETNERIVARIVSKDGTGILDIARRNARALVHSSVMTSANDARLATYRKNARFIKGVRWLATLDSDTCLVCGNLDKQAWDLDGKKLRGTTLDFRAPPAHWSCRCVLTGLPKSESDEGPTIGARASSEGPVAPNTGFNDFLKRQSPEFIERVLGKRRAELYLAGKITLRDLVSGTGRELTLDELRAA